MSRDDQQQLEKIAYQSWLSRGCPIGSPEVDWEHACKVVSMQLTVIDKAEAQTHKPSIYDELGGEEDTPSDPESVSPFAAAARTESNNAHEVRTTTPSRGKGKDRKQDRENSSTSRR